MKQPASAIKHELKSSAPSGPARPITLRRDKQGALKFNGERIGAATRTETIEAHPQYNGWSEDHTMETSARLFKTASGKYVVGIEIYDRDRGTL